MAKVTRVLNRMASGIGGSAALLGLAAAGAAASGSWEAASFIVSAAAFARDAVPARAGAALPGNRPALAGRHVIDADGTPKTPTVLCRELGYPDADETVVGHWLRNGGAVEIDGRRVKLRAETVAPAALAVLVEHLMGLPAGPVRVQVYADGWVDELHPSPRAALGRIGEAVSATSAPTAGRFQCRVAAPDRAEGAGGALVDLWRQAGGQFSDGLMPALRASGLWENLVIVAADRRGGLKWAGFGAKNWAFTAEWRRWAVGQSTTATPDAEFGAWVTDAYRRALTGAGPMVRHVNAKAVMPGGEAVRHVYTATDAPFRLSSGGIVLLCHTQPSSRAPLLLH